MRPETVWLYSSKYQKKSAEYIRKWENPTV